MSKKQVRGAEATSHLDDNKTTSSVQEKIKTVHGMVYELLEKIPATRSSDRILVAELYSHFYGVGNEPFWQVMEQRSDLPSYETIGRCRRKIQETNEELRAVREVEDERISRQEDFIEYAKGGVA